jgi:hypothetical protein
MRKAKVRRINGTYGRVAPKEKTRQFFGIDPSVPSWKQLPNTEDIRDLLIALAAKATGTDSRKSTSFHEAAHAVFWELAEYAVEFASAFPFYDGRDGNGWTLGVVEPEGGGLIQLDGYIEGILAADLAQEKAGFGHADMTVSDQKQLENLITEINTSFLSDGIVTGLLTQKTYLDLVPRVKRKLDDPQVWAAIVSLASRLQESEVVQGDEVREIVARCCPVIAKAA